MAETDFILSIEAQNSLLAFLLKNNLVFVPSLHYEKPLYIELSAVEDINIFINSNTLTGPIFLPKNTSGGYDFRFGHFIKNEKDVYHIEQRMGIPCLNFSPSKLKEGYSPPLIISGSISYYSSYFIDEKYTEIKAPDWIKVIYKEVNKFFGMTCKKVKVKDIRRWYWVDNNLLPFLGKTYRTNVIDLDL